MAKSIKLGSDTYLDWSGVTVDNTGKTLASKLGTVFEVVHQRQSLASGSITISVVPGVYAVLCFQLGGLPTCGVWIVKKTDYANGCVSAQIANMGASYLPTLAVSTSGITLTFSGSAFDYTVIRIA